MLPSLGEKPRTLVRQSIHRLKPVKMLKGVRDLLCNTKSSVAQRDIVTPQNRGSVDNPSTRGIFVDVE